MNAPKTEELVEKLTDFGLTTNQARVYLNVVQSQTTIVNRISQETNLCRQDIYKMMPKLQKMGLVTRILGKPTRFEALPIEKALRSLLATEKIEARVRISRLSADLKTLTENLQRSQNCKPAKADSPIFSLLTTDSELKNKFNLSFEKACKEFSIVTTPKLAPRTITAISERVKSLARKGVKTRVIIESSVDEVTRTFLDKLDRAHECLIAKQVKDATLMPYRLIDSKEVWIELKKETESGTPWFLWTNSPNIVEFYKENFERLWGSPETKPL